MLKAFASGCSAVTGVEAIANGVPAFREPRVRNAQRTEIALGVLLGVMLVGLAILIRAHHVVPRGGVTILAQLTAGAFGTGWPFYVSNLAVTRGARARGEHELRRAAGADEPARQGPPAAAPLLPARRAARLPATGSSRWRCSQRLLLVAVSAQTNKLIPLFTIGVFVGFTISQVGLVRHWRTEPAAALAARAALNGAGAVMTAVAVVVFPSTSSSPARGW